MKSKEEVSRGHKKSESVSRKKRAQVKKERVEARQKQKLRPPRHSLQLCSPDSPARQSKEGLRTRQKQQEKGKNWES